MSRKLVKYGELVEEPLAVGEDCVGRPARRMLRPLSDATEGTEGQWAIDTIKAFDQRHKPWRKGKG